MSVKKSLKAGVTAAYNPIKGTKMSADIVKRDLKHKIPEADTSAQDALLEQQRLQAAALDEEENRRRKKLLSAAQGTRAFRGSSMFRAKPSNTAGAAAQVAAAAAGGAAPAYAGRASGGYAGRVTPFKMSMLA